MARIDTPADPLADLAFEVERFEWTSDDRLVVTGRWFGVRGRRFMRPTLHLRVDGRRRRLIAVLDHKPWAADTDETWTAAFAWRGERGAVTTPRLEVSPDLVLDLPLPGADAAGATLTPRPRPKRPPRKPPSPPPAAAVPTEPSTSTATDSAAMKESPAPGTVPASPSAAEPSTPAETPPPASPSVPFDPGPIAETEPSGVAADIHLLALERRLVEERAERERIGEQLADARGRLEALSAHQASAVERANEVVRLEGELAAALVRAEAAERRAATLERQLKAAERQGAEAEALESRLEDVREDLAEARAPLDVEPLPSRVARRRRNLPQEDSSARLVTAVVVVVVLVLFVLLLATIV